MTVSRITHPLPLDSGVRRIDPLEDPDWDARVDALPSASFFHGADWARVLHGTYGFQPVYFALGESEHLQAVLPTMEVSSWLTGRRGISLPFADECGPLCQDAGSFNDLFNAVLGYAKARQWKYVEFRGGKPLFQEAPASTSFFGHRLDLRGGEAAVLGRFDSSVRRAIRKAGESSLVIEFSQDLEAMQAFYGLLCKTRRRHGVPPQPFCFFENIQRHVLGHKKGWVVLARHDRIPVAGAVFFHHGTTALYKFGASDEDFQRLRGNNLVMCEAIKWYARQGCTVLDFGRTSLFNDGLRKFKLGWGSEERTIEYVRYDPRACSFVVSRDKSAGWHNRVFQHLPIFLSRLIGASLYRHIA
jgi:hypothetical protein